MNSLRYAACILALGLVPPAWAINKCTDAQGKVSFQEAPCPGEGEKIEVRPAMPAPAVAPPPRKPSKEGAFGETWRRKQYLQSQGIPQARAALERNQRECAAAPAEAVAHAGASAAWQPPPRLPVRARAGGRWRQGQGGLRGTLRGAAPAAQGAGEGTGRTLNRHAQNLACGLRRPLQGCCRGAAGGRRVLLGRSGGGVPRQVPRALAVQRRQPAQHLTHHDDARAAQPFVRNGVGQLVQRGRGMALLGQAGVLDHGHGRVCAEPLQQPFLEGGARRSCPCR
jgi:hypothetical protein